MKIKGSKVQYVKLKRQKKRRLSDKETIVRKQQRPSRYERVVYPDASKIASGIEKLGNKGIDIAVGATTGEIKRRIRNSPLPNPVKEVLSSKVDNLVGKGASALRARLNRGRGRPLGSKNKQKQEQVDGVLTSQPDKIIPDQPNVAYVPADISLTTRYSFGRRMVGNTLGKVYKLKDRFETPRSAWLREKMKETPRVSIITRDDNQEWTDSDYNRRAYSTCGLNRKGVYAPYPSNNNFAHTLTDYSTKGYFSFATPTNTHMFLAQDYNKATYAQLMMAYLESAQLTQEERDQMRITFPLVRRRMITTITNRTAYTPTDFTLYLLKNKATVNGSFYNVDPSDSFYFGTQNTLPTKYKYPVVNEDSYTDAGASVPTVQMRTETSMHLAATPFMAKNFESNFEVVRVHKFRLQPDDIMQYTCSVGMNGLPLEALRSNGVIDYKWNTDRQYWSKPLGHDYSLLLTFKGGVKTTAAYAKYVAASGENPARVEYPIGMATDNVTVPAMVTMRTKIVMDVLDDDYYDLKIVSNRRRDQWNGVQAWISSGNNADVVESRLAIMNDIAIRKPREYPELFNVAFTDMVDPDRVLSSGQSGWYTQVQSDVSWKTVNNQATPS